MLMNLSIWLPMALMHCDEPLSATGAGERAHGWHARLLLVNRHRSSRDLAQPERVEVAPNTNACVCFKHHLHMQCRDSVVRSHTLRASRFGPVPALSFVARAVVSALAPFFHIAASSRSVVEHLDCSRRFSCMLPSTRA